jgi:hypothetical protein
MKIQRQSEAFAYRIAAVEDPEQVMRQVYEPYPPRPPGAHTDDGLTPHLMMPTDAVHHYREYDRPYDANTQMLERVIRDQGIRQPLKISTDGTHAMLIEGNHRLAVAKKLGIKQLPVQVFVEKPGEVMTNSRESQPVPLEPVLGDWIKQNHQLLRSFFAKRRVAMPAPMPEGMTFHYHPTRETVPNYIPRSQFSVPGVEARHNGTTCGWLCWTDGSPEDGGRPVGEINDVYVSHPQRHHGIATALFDFAKQHEPNVHHSDTLSEAGRKWREHEESRPTKQAAYYDPSDYFTNDSDKYHYDYDVPSDPMLLHRGVGFGKGELPPELEQRIEAVKAGESDPKLGADLITHMGRDGQGLGGFWTHSKDGPWLAEGYSRRTHHGPWDNNQADHSVVLSGDWDGNNGDLEHAFDADYRKLNPGAPIHVHTVRLHTPKGWVSLGGDPDGVMRTARNSKNLFDVDGSIEREAMAEIAKPAGMTVKRYRDRDAGQLRNELVDQNGAACLWKTLSNVMPGDSYYIARDKAGQIKGVLRALKTPTHNFTNELYTSSDAPPMTGSHLLRELAKDTQKQGKTLAVAEVLNGARPWWEAMGANLSDKDGQPTRWGVWSPEAHQALIDGSTLETTPSIPPENDPELSFNGKEIVPPEMRLPGSARGFSEWASTRR